jgi:alanyl-tRNA synthetase
LGRGIGNVDLSVFRQALEHGPNQFTGYEELRRESTVTSLLDLAAATLVPAAVAGDEVGIVVNITPFYAESGGQEGDHGRFVFDGGAAEVFDVQTPVPGLVVHRARILDGELTVGTTVAAEVDPSRRAAVSRAHTATHLVHRAFRGVLGESATQAGSLNAPGRLRFDFHSPSAVPGSVVRDVEDEVNEVLLRDLPVSAFVTSLDEARRLGAMALFGEKYGTSVRVVDVGERDAPYARELCGGTHVAHSAVIGAVTLLSESSIAAGTRRVEGLVGLDAFRFLARERLLLEQVTSAIKATRAEEVPERVNDIVTRLRDAERQLERLRADAVLASAGQLAAGAKDVGGVSVVAAQAPEGTGAKDVRTLAVDVRGRLGDRPGVVVIAASADGKVPLVVALTPAAVDRGLTANDILRAATAHVGGSGGGRDPQLAQGAGSNAGALGEAFAAVEVAITASGQVR